MLKKYPGRQEPEFAIHTYNKNIYDNDINSNEISENIQNTSDLILENKNEYTTKNNSNEFSEIISNPLPSLQFTLEDDNNFKNDILESYISMIKKIQFDIDQINLDIDQTGSNSIKIDNTSLNKQENSPSSSQSNNNDLPHQSPECRVKI